MTSRSGAVPVTWMMPAWMPAWWCPRQGSAACPAISLLVAITAAAGIFCRGDGGTSQAVGVRGERSACATSGVYRFNAQRIAAEGIGWDVVTLFGVVPAMLLALASLRRGSLRGPLFVVGLLGYSFYQYLTYAVTWAFGPLFPLPTTVHPSGQSNSSCRGPQS